MNTKALSAGIAASLTIWTVTAAQAKAPTDGVGCDGNAVTYSGQVLLRIRTGAGGYTAAQRAEHVSNRLVPILSMENLRPEDITVQQSRPYQDANIFVRDRLLITVDKGLAQANGNNDPGDLAREWAEHIRHVLPNVSVKPNPNGA